MRTGFIPRYSRKSASGSDLATPNYFQVGSNANCCITGFPEADFELPKSLVYGKVDFSTGYSFFVFTLLAAISSLYRARTLSALI